MYRIVIIILGIFFNLGLNAQQVSQNEMKKIQRMFEKEYRISEKPASVFPIKHGNDTLGMVINYNHAFVLISAKKELPPIKAYSLENDLVCTICSFSPNVRYGCWVCTVIKKDRALEALSTIDQKWMVLHEIKELIRKVSKIKKLREHKNGIPRKLNKLGRLVMIAIVVKAIRYCPDSMVGYIDDPNLRRKIKRWIQKLLKSNDEYPLRFAGITIDDVNFVLNSISALSNNPRLK